MRIGIVQKRLITDILVRPMKFKEIKKRYLNKYGKFYNMTNKYTIVTLLLVALRKLNDKGLISRTNEYKNKTYSLTPKAIELLNEYDMKELLSKAIYSEVDKNE